MSRARGHFKYYLLSARNDLLFLLGILLVIIVGKTITVLASQEGLVTGGHTISSVFMIFASFFLIGIGTANMYETFPYVMSLSSTRKEFYLGLIARYALVSVMFATLQTLLYYFEALVYRLSSVEYAGYVDMFGRKLSNGVALFVISFIFFMFLLSIFGFLGFLMVRFTFKKVFIFTSVIGVGAYMVSLAVPQMNDIWLNILKSLAAFITQGSNLEFALKSGAGMVFILACGWLLIRRAEVKVLATVEK